MLAPFAARFPVPNRIPLKTRFPSLSLNCFSELNPLSSRLTRQLGPSLVTKQGSVLECLTDSVSQVVCPLSLRSSTDARTATILLDLCSSMRQAMPRRLLLPASSLKGAHTAILGTTAASTSRMMTTTTPIRIGICQPRGSMASFLLFPIQRRLAMLLPGMIRGLPSTAVVPVLPILHQDTRALLALPVKDI